MLVSLLVFKTFLVSQLFFSLSSFVVSPSETLPRVTSDDASAMPVCPAKQIWKWEQRTKIENNYPEEELSNRHQWAVVSRVSTPLPCQCDTAPEQLVMDWPCLSHSSHAQEHPRRVAKPFVPFPQTFAREMNKIVIIANLEWIVLPVVCEPNHSAVSLSREWPPQWARQENSLRMWEKIAANQDCDVVKTIFVWWWASWSYTQSRRMLCCHLRIDYRRGQIWAWYYHTQASRELAYLSQESLWNKQLD